MAPPVANRALRRQPFQERLCLLQIERVEAFGEPAINRSEQFANLLRLALALRSRAMLIAARSSQDFDC